MPHMYLAYWEATIWNPSGERQSSAEPLHTVENKETRRLHQDLPDQGCLEQNTDDLQRSRMKTATGPCYLDIPGLNLGLVHWRTCRTGVPRVPSWWAVEDPPTGVDLYLVPIVSKFCGNEGLDVWIRANTTTKALSAFSDQMACDFGRSDDQLRFVDVAEQHKADYSSIKAELAQLLHEHRDEDAKIDLGLSLEEVPGFGARVMDGMRFREIPRPTIKRTLQDPEFLPPLGPGDPMLKDVRPRD